MEHNDNVEGKKEETLSTYFQEEWLHNIHSPVLGLSKSRKFLQGWEGRLEFAHFDVCLGSLNRFSSVKEYPIKAHILGNEQESIISHIPFQITPKEEMKEETLEHTYVVASLRRKNW